MKAIPLHDVCFLEDLAPLLGVSHSFVLKLVSRRTRETDDWHKRHPFPNPFYVSSSGIRVWFVTDVENWCRNVRLKATTLRLKRMGVFGDRPDIMERVLGL